MEGFNKKKHLLKKNIFVYTSHRIGKVLKSINFRKNYRVYLFSFISPAVLMLQFYALYAQGEGGPPVLHIETCLSDKF